MDTYNLSFPDVAIDAILATGYELQNAGYIFRGVASEQIGTPSERSWVLAGEGETGHGFTSPVPKGYIGVCVFNGTSWTGKLLKCVSIDSTPTNGSTNAVSSGGAYASISQLGDTVNEALDNLTFTDTTPSAFLGEYITEKVSTTDGGLERILTYFTILSATASKAGLLSAADKAKLDALWSYGYQFAGIATPSTTPISTTSKIFYIATEAGTYFNTVTVTQGINIIYKSGDTWSVAQVVGIDNEPTAGSDRLVKSGGVFGELALGAVYDVSAKNPTAGPNSNGKWESLSALLSDANLNTLIPTSVRKGGMSIKYVQSSDNKYVQYRYMGTDVTTVATFTNTANWQGVDDEPTAGSENLVKSGGVGNILNVIPKYQSLLTAYQEEAGWSLIGNGYCKQDINSKLVKYAVTPGSVLKLKISKDNDGVFQFQTDVPVTTSGTTSVVGTPFTTAIDSIIEVPNGAKYLIVSQFLSNETNSITKITEWCPKAGTGIILSGNNLSIVKDISWEQITLNSNGFGVFQQKNGKFQNIGFVGYVAGEDESETYVMRGRSGEPPRIVWYIDLDSLTPGTRTSFSKAIKSVNCQNEISIPDNSYILAVAYYNTIIPHGLLSFAVVNNETQISKLDTRVSALESNKLFNTKLFEPEFYAYLHGRLNAPNGVGQSWYKRFCIIHISDVHQYNTLMKEAINLAQNKADVIINTGDDGNGNTQTTHEQSMAWLNTTVNLVNNTNTDNVRYLENKGNHDVCNINRSDFRNTIGSLMETLSSNFVWGNTDGGYGYVDIAGTANMGTIRIILLDPFDYPDGDFPSVRAFMSATFSQNQIDWLISSLVDAATNGYHVVTAMHYSFGDNSLQFNEDKAKPDATFYQDPFMIPDIIDAIQNKTTLNKTYTDSKNVQNITINEDFTNVADLDYVCHLFGHIHSKNEYWCQKSDGSKMYDILMLGEAALGTYGNALNKVYRNSGTINEIEFSALEIDTIEKTIYRVSYGAYLKYDGSNDVTNRTTIFNYRKQ